MTPEARNTSMVCPGAGRWRPWQPGILAQRQSVTNNYWKSFGIRNIWFNKFTHIKSNQSILMKINTECYMKCWFQANFKPKRVVRTHCNYSISGKKKSILYEKLARFALLCTMCVFPTYHLNKWLSLHLLAHCIDLDLTQRCALVARRKETLLLGDFGDHWPITCVPFIYF